MTLLQVGALFLAAVLGGALNSVAGGGTFITFPALVVTNVPAINANATSTVALWPGTVASAGAYRGALRVRQDRLALLVVMSLIGGFIGAQVLLHTPPPTFLKLIPYLMLLATLLFAFGGRITTWIRSRSGKRQAPVWISYMGTALLQLAISVYGGFFGGGIGILMLSLLSLMGLENIHTMNALKTVLTAVINGVAVITFIIYRFVYWPQASVMILGAILGGYGGAAVAQRLDQRLVRAFVIVVGLSMSVYFFFR
jgi:uncharacterized protein